MINLIPAKCKEAIEDFDTPGLVLLTIALHAFKDDLMGDPDTDVPAMDPVEVWTGLYDLYGGWVTEEGQNRLNALLLALQGDLFYKDEEVFRAVAAALIDGDIGDIINGSFDEIDAVDVAWAVTEVELARDTDEHPEFSRRVTNFIQSIMADGQQEHDDDMKDVEDLYLDCMARMIAIGVTANELRLLDPDYAQALQALEELHVSQPDVQF